MPLFPYNIFTPRYKSEGMVSASTSLTTITSNVSANTKGSWVEIVSSTAFVATGADLMISVIDGDRSFLFDIGIGGSGSETVMIPNLPACSRNGREVTSSVYYPLFIPAGVRLSARCQDSTGGGNMLFGLCLRSTSMYSPIFDKSATYGAITSTSLGTTVIPALNSKGSWVEITSSIDFDCRYMLVCWSADSNTEHGDVFLDIGVGATSSEVVLVPNVFNGSMGGTLDRMYQPHVGIPVTIPQGTRIACRAQYKGNSGITDDLEIILVTLG